MLPGSDVPLAEEDELYDVEILDGSNVVLRTIRVTVDGGDPALLTASLNPQYVSFNDLLSPTVADGSSNAYTGQLLDRSGSWIEARLSTAGGDFASIGLIEPQYAPRWGYQLPTGIYRSTLDFSPTGLPGMQITEAAPGDTSSTLKYSSGSLGVNAVRIRIVIVGSEVRYYWDYTGDGSVPFYVSNIPAPLPLAGVVSVVNATAAVSKVQNIFMGQLVTPSTVYQVAQQVNDFGSAQSAIKVRVYQISAVVGRGPFAEATL